MLGPSCHKRAHLTVLLALAIGVVTVLSGACGSSDACVPGDQKACACPGGTSGVQACAADGASYEACVCGTSAASTGASTTGSTGSGTGSASSSSNVSSASAT